MARRATIQLKVHGKVVQSIPLDEEDVECLIQGLRLITTHPSPAPIVAIWRGWQALVR